MSVDGGGCWQVVVDVDRWWWVLAGGGGCWQVVVDVDRWWWLLAGGGDGCWRVMVVGVGGWWWWVLAGSGGGCCRCSETQDGQNPVQAGLDSVQP